MRTIRTPKKRAQFLKKLIDTAGNVSAACEAVRISRRAAYEWREADEKFAKDWDGAVDLTTDALEQEVYRRAHVGTEKPVFYQGEECGIVREYSDTLAMFILKARRPDKYRERHEISNPDGSPLMQPIAEAILKAYGSESG